MTISDQVFYYMWLIGGDEFWKHPFITFSVYAHTWGPMVFHEFMGVIKQTVIFRISFYMVC